MGLSRSTLTTVFSAEWVAAAKGAPEAGMTATGRIFDPNTATTSWVPGTGMVTSVDAWYDGKMRVQPIRSSNTVDGNLVQFTQVSVPIDGPFTVGMNVHVGYSMDLSACPLNPDLLNYVYTCVEIADSSNPVERTLIFLVNHGLSA